MSEKTGTYRQQDEASTSHQAGRGATARTPRKPADVYRGLTAAPRARDGLISILAVLVCIALASLPLVLDIHRPDVVRSAEAQQLAVTFETARANDRQTHWRLGQLIPQLAQQPRLDIPPGVVWLQQQSWWVGHATSLIGRITAARVTTAVATALLVGCIFWLGHSFGGLTAGWVAGIAAAGLPWFLYTGRWAEPTMVGVSLVTLSLAAGVWAMRPLRPTPSATRQFLGWDLSGLAMGLAGLTGGAGMVPMVLLPLLLLGVQCPRRLQHALGIIAASLVASLVAMPWALYLHSQDPLIWQHWLHMISPMNVTDRDGAEAMLRPLVSVLVFLLPWTGAVVVALIQPISHSSSGVRRRYMLGWSWVVLSWVMLFLAPPWAREYALAVALAASLVLWGVTAARFSYLSQQGRHARLWQFLRWGYGIGALLVPIVVALWLAFEPMLVQRGYISHPRLVRFEWYYPIGAFLALELLAIGALRFALGHHPGRAVSLWSIMVIAAVTLIVLPASRGPAATNLDKHAAYLLGNQINGRPVFFVVDHKPAKPQAAIEPATPPLFENQPDVIVYGRFAPRPVSPPQLQAMANQGDDAMILTRTDQPPHANCRLFGRYEQINLMAWTIENHQTQSHEKPSHADTITPQ